MKLSSEAHPQGTISESLTSDAKAGRTDYLKTMIRAVRLNFGGHAVLTLMPQEEGENERDTQVRLGLKMPFVRAI